MKSVSILVAFDCGVWGVPMVKPIDQLQYSDLSQLMLFSMFRAKIKQA